MVQFIQHQSVMLEMSLCRETKVSSVQHEVRDIQDSLEDTGVTHLIPIPCPLSSLEAEPEKAVLKRPKASDLMQENGSHEEVEVGVQYG